MIIVTGATGKLGQQIVEHLLTRVPADRVGVSVRDPQKPRARAFADRGVRVRQGSFTDAGSLAHAFEGASQILVVSADRMGQECVDLHRTAIGAAVAAGARRILYTSQMGAGEASHFQACRDHAATEAILRDSGVPHTSLRNGFYAASAVNFLDRALPNGEIVLPADGPVAWTAHADLAEATAAVLADEGRFEGPTPPLTASSALAFDDIAEIATELTGRTFTRTTAPDGAFRDQLVGHGVPEIYADQVLGIFAAARAGEFSVTDPTLARLLGREPAGVRDVLRDALRERTSAA
ncbi:NmrA family NAD(P)-binding protein [Streptomyces mayonensis]|uniref:NmrA family NAD(P)-binding protein n=1 Tax=Streptomyces mayonensis TaxID=2750816 RepID=UPI001C1DEF26|nr:NmrA family NAD(P)-binding protein [Streptomyces sp. A108]MBU6530752.1 NmrA family NAD(P)-binding protein [Streptomyces sp. A108]